MSAIVAASSSIVFAKAAATVPTDSVTTSASSGAFLIMVDYYRFLPTRTAAKRGDRVNGPSCDSSLAPVIGSYTSTCIGPRGVNGTGALATSG
ncbi:MAG: hypothetical protein ACREQL_06890, partial [Candidatus Binatia bacterium]